jgi:hypothetical protein
VVWIRGVYSSPRRPYLNRPSLLMPDASGVLKLMCWGRNLSGQLGDGTLTERSTPTLVREPANP